MIRQLDAATVAKIAAGEVIERPASVVKELVENSIDAGARRIVVTCRRGGFEVVQVADDGCGMVPEDAPLAFARHSTSKLACAGDLARVGTLGFRGEALPSIAAVARVEMVTCPAGAASGTRVVAEGGQVVAVEEVGARPGTRVTVREVLAGLPARRKFLSDPHREGLRCVEVVMRLAAGYPHIAFRMEMDDRLVLSTPGDGSLPDTLAALYGPDLARSLIPLDPPGEGLPAGVLGVTGYVGGPATFRARRWSQTVYVNGRPVRAPALLGVVEAAYGPLLPPGRHPFVIMFLTLSPERVDVNVHPAKAEVRLQGEEGVRSLLGHMVARALAASDLSAPLLSGGAGTAAAPEHPEGAVAPTARPAGPA
ncbi:MAG: DNA mismatch repair endonuclease MutL, partial [Bacillota bacterium]|nr:DNA mismatch repair endonuclease MutL [Bacillota bacterium]